MKRLMLLGTLCLAGLAALPVTSASALTGSCKIVGTAKFKKGAGPAEKLPFVTPEQRGYEFTGVPGNGFEELGKSGCLNQSAAKKSLEVATVKGEGKLACVVAFGLVPVKEEVNLTGEIAGSGTIKVEGGKATVDNFGFKFVAAGGNVPFTAEGNEVGGKVLAAGNAEFLTPGGQAAKEKVLEECRKGEVTELPFEAVAAGTIE